MLARRLLSADGLVHASTTCSHSVVRKCWENLCPSTSVAAVLMTWRMMSGDAILSRPIFNPYPNGPQPSCKHRATRGEIVWAILNPCSGRDRAFDAAVEPNFAMAGAATDCIHGPAEASQL